MRRRRGAAEVDEGRAAGRGRRGGAGAAAAGRPVRGLRASAVARALIVGCGCRGRLLGERLLAEGWQVRGTSRREEGLAAIEAAGIEPALADPAEPGTVLELVGDVAMVVWLLGSAEGTDEELAGDPRPAAGPGAGTAGRNAGAGLRLRGGGQRRPDPAGARQRGGRGRLRNLAHPGRACSSTQRRRDLGDPSRSGRLGDERRSSRWPAI